MRLRSYLRTVWPSSFHFRMAMTALRFAYTRLISLLPSVSLPSPELFVEAAAAAAFFSTAAATAAAACAEKRRAAQARVARKRMERSNIFVLLIKVDRVTSVCLVSLCTITCKVCSYYYYFFFFLVFVFNKNFHCIINSFCQPLHFFFFSKRVFFLW